MPDVEGGQAYLQLRDIGRKARGPIEDLKGDNDAR